ncbi:MAG: ABC transporter ATP-binding protein [Clostridia bacterium]|nr:ABC transporter ATP-binding protein [Clostridia bacterium]
MSELLLSNVSYRYKNTIKYAVVCASCVFESGTLYAVTGPSGSGKSTLLSLLAGLDTPTEGAILLNGVNLSTLDLDRYRRESISMIFQSFCLFPLMTVIENVCYPMELKGVSPKAAKLQAAAHLARVGITPTQMNRFPSHLSGGEQQRTAIARSLASGAKILLADEPTGNLDVKNTTMIVDILAELAHGEGYCVIIVTHDTNVANAADAVFRMVDGELCHA